MIRHGQASFGEKNYDNLSKKGVKQSIALGKKLLKNGISFDQTIIGPLNRHKQTFNGINEGYEGGLNDPKIIDEFAENQLMEIAQYFIPKILKTDQNIKEIFDAVPFWKRKRKFLEYFNIEKLSDLPSVDELSSAGLIDDASIDSSIFGTGKFFKEQSLKSNDTLYRDIDKVIKDTPKNEE